MSLYIGENVKWHNFLKNWYFKTKFGQEVYFDIKNGSLSKEFKHMKKFPIFPDFLIFPAKNYIKLNRTARNKKILFPLLIRN